MVHLRGKKRRKGREEKGKGERTRAASLDSLLIVRNKCIQLERGKKGEEEKEEGGGKKKEGNSTPCTRNRDGGR